MNLNDLLNDEIFTIAEIGINHNGNFDKAVKMIEEAVNCGAHSVKFQSFSAEKLYSVYTESLLQKGIEEYPDRKIIDFFNNFSLSYEELKELKQMADKKNIILFSSPFDLEAVDELMTLDVKLFKVASSEITNVALLEKIAKTKIPTLISTGMCYDFEIKSAVEIFNKNNCDIALMHCVSLYPPDSVDVNLSRMLRIGEQFNVITGFSDHTSGVDVPLIAVHMGAKIIEKHFMLEDDKECPDFSVSITPTQFKNLVDKISFFEKVVGKSKNISSPGKKELIIAKSARKSIFAARDIKKGEKLTFDDFSLKRPGVGFPAYDLHKFVGKIAKVDIMKDFLIRNEYLM